MNFLRDIIDANRDEKAHIRRVNWCGGILAPKRYRRRCAATRNFSNEYPNYFHSEEYRERKKIIQESTLPKPEKWVVVKRGRETIEDKKKKEFYELFKRWKAETGGYSTSFHIVNNKNYKDIIGMSEDAAPYIFRELKTNPEYLFDALMHIYRPSKDPVKKRNYGNVDKMAQDWLSWAQKQNISF